MGAANGLRINPHVRRLVCSMSGQEVDSNGFERPIGLCSCCPAPGKPVIVEYHLDRIELARPRPGCGMWSYAELLPVESKGTIADGLDVPGAIMGHGILRTIRESRGTAVAVSEAEILASFEDCGLTGVAASFEGAAVVAAMHRLCAAGTIEPGGRVLLLLTASHFVPLGQRRVPGWEG